MNQKFASLNENELTTVVGGRRRHRYCHDGYETGRAVKAIGTVVQIAGQIIKIFGH